MELFTTLVSSEPKNIQIKLHFNPGLLRRNKRRVTGEGGGVHKDGS